MALYTIPKRRTTAQNVSQIIARALQGILAGREQKRRGEMEERGMGLQEAIGQARIGEMQRPRPEKPVFTPSHIATALGTLEAGGYKGLLGETIRFQDKQEAVNYALRQLGRLRVGEELPNYWREAMEIINRKYPEGKSMILGQTAYPPVKKDLLGAARKAATMPRAKEPFEARMRLPKGRKKAVTKTLAKPLKRADRVKVISPDGEWEGTIPRSQLAEALKQGYKLATGR